MLILFYPVARKLYMKNDVVILINKKNRLFRSRVMVLLLKLLN